MGIPLFTKTITRKYPTIIDTQKPKCSRLFLDLNCAIHQCANNVLSNTSQYIHDTYDMQNEKIQKDIVNHTIDYINKIVHYAQPTELVYIAIDGLPPVAKMIQQRKRRFISSWRQNIIKKRLSECKQPFLDWDRNQITPGTSFMDYLNKSLYEYFMTKNKFSCPIIFTDSNESGEGEAKILTHIKTTSPPEFDDIIYGLDADLIMLGLLSSKNDIYLLREPAQYDIKIAKPFLFLNINLLRKYISVECSDNSKEYNENLVWDYVTMCFLVGNDFIPPLSFLKIRHNGIEMLMQNHRKIHKELNQYLVMEDPITKEKELNYLFLLKLFELLKNVEDPCIIEAEDHYYSKKPISPVGKKTIYDRITFEIDNYPSLHKFPNVIQTRKTGWRLNYYHYLFHMTEIEDINDICLNYLQGIEWTFNYYFKSCISQDWHYKYAYSPTILDIHNYLMINLENADVHCRYTIENQFPKVNYTTDMQLLLVLPPSSKTLLKKELQTLMTDISKGCVHFYPENFDITTYLKTYLWEASPILPPIDTRQIEAKVNEIVK